MTSVSSRVRELRVDPDHDGQRLDNFLVRELSPVPRSLIYRLIRTGQVRINGGRARPMRKLCSGDRVRIPPVRGAGRGEVEIPAARIDQIAARIVHRQAEFMIVDKPAGMASQAGSGLPWGLSDVIRRIDDRALPVHRLDRDTSGLIVFALGAVNARSLQQLFRDRRVVKHYLALVTGHLPDAQVAVDQPLKKIRDRSGQRRVVADPHGQPALSVFRRLERLAGHDLVEVEIATGRTHQIRAHARHLGVPLAGDERYNPGAAPAGLGRLFLHAARIGLPWPADRVFSAPLPETLAGVVDALR